MVVSRLPARGTRGIENASRIAATLTLNLEYLTQRWRETRQSGVFGSNSTVGTEPVGGVKRRRLLLSNLISWQPTLK